MLGTNDDAVELGERRAAAPVLEPDQRGREVDFRFPATVATVAQRASDASTVSKYVGRLYAMMVMTKSSRQRASASALSSDWPPWMLASVSDQRCSPSSASRCGRSADSATESEPRAGCFGCHLGQEDLAALAPADAARLAASGLRLGVSTHCLAELAVAAALAPTYVALGPVFGTTSKRCLLYTSPSPRDRG